MKTLVSVCVLLLLSLAAASQALGASAAALRFTPPAGDATLREFADGLGKTPEERQQLLAAVTTAKTQLFERLYAAKGWKNNVAGAYAYFVVSMEYVHTGQEPDASVQDQLFARLGETMAPDLAGVSDRDKAALYDTLIANASLPLLLYIDAKEKGNPAQVEHARTLAAEYGRKILKLEPAELSALLRPAAGAAAVASASAPPASTGGSQLDGRYECTMSNVMHGAGGNFSVYYQPTGLWFQIQGNRYTTSGAGGTVQVSGDVVSFTGGGYGGWRGSLGSDAINFREDTANPRPGAAAGLGDLRCGRVSR